MLTIVTGALAGFVHVLSGPDHLAAVTPMAIAGRERGWVSGWTWGFGHASGVVVVAMLAVLLRDVLPPVEAISAWSERIVGAALIAVGLWAFAAARRCGRPRTRMALSHTGISTSSQARRGFDASDMPTRRSAWACSTVSPAARISSECFPRWRCRR